MAAASFTPVRGTSLAALFAISCAAPPPPAEPPVAVLSAAPAGAPVASVELRPAPSASAAPMVDSAAAELAKRSVLQRLPDLAKRHEELTPSPHAVQLELVAEAIARADTDMFVSYRARGEGAFPVLDYELTDAGHFPTYPEGDVSTGLLARYGGTTNLGYVSGGASYILSFAVDARPLRDRTPGLVWSVEVDEGEAYVLFVSVDGESYGLDPSALEMSLDPPEKWPPPVSSPAFGRMAFTVARRPETRALGGVDAAVAKCAEQARKRLSQAQIEADPAVEARWVRTNCRNAIAAWEKTFAALIEDSVAARTTLVERAKARLRGTDATKAP